MIFSSDNLVRLGDYLDVAIGGTPSRKVSEYWDTEKRSKNVWLSIKDISALHNGRASDSSEYISDEGVKKSNVKLIPKNTALMTFKLTIGKTAITKADLYTNEAIAAFIPKPGVSADPYYLACVLPLLRYDSDQAVKGKTLNKSKIENALIPLPDIAKQRVLRTALLSIDASVYNTHEVLAKNSQLKKALLEKLLTTGIGHQTFVNTKQGPLPATWRSTVFKNTGTLTRGPFGGALKKSIFVPQGYKVYEQQNAIYQDLNRGKYFVDQEKYDEMKRFAVKEGDILISCSGTIGRSVIIGNDFPAGIINQALLKLSVSPDWNNRYVNYIIRSDSFQSNIKLSAPGSAMINMASMDHIRNIPVPQPPLPEQVEIADMLDVISNNIRINQELLSRQKKLKKAVLHDMLAGKVQL